MANTLLEKPDIRDIGYKKPSLFSDIVICCDGRQWMAHRVVLSMRSHFFEKACSDKFKEGITGEIVLHEDDPGIVDLMIDFLYRQDYGNEGSSLETHAHVYAIADKYEILSLKEWAALKSRRALKRTSKDDADRVAAALEVVWTTTPQQDGGLRSLFLLWVGDNLDKVLDSERYFEVVKGHADLAMDIIRDLSCRQKKGESYCDMCGANRTATDWSCGHFGPVIPPKYFRD